MSLKMITAVWSIPMQPSAKLVLLALADIAGDDGICRPHQKTIATKSCLSLRTVGACIQKLEADGLLETNPNVDLNGMMRGLVYRILPFGKNCVMAEDHSANSADAPFGKSRRMITRGEPLLEPKPLNQPKPKKLTPPKSPPPCPVDAIVALWNELMPFPPYGLSKVCTVSPSLHKTVAARWREDADRQSLDWWRDYFVTSVGGSDFLTGKKTDFRAGFDWVVGPKNMSKILNGCYTNRGGDNGQGNFSGQRAPAAKTSGAGNRGAARTPDYRSGDIPFFDDPRFAGDS